MLGAAVTQAVACGAQMENMKNMGSKLPSGNAAGRLVRTVLIGGAAVYGITHSLFNVEGGHRAIVFNRFGGLKDKARWPPHCNTAQHGGKPLAASAPGQSTVPASQRLTVLAGY